jgi:hypothetical protein
VLRAFCNVMMRDYCWHGILPFITADGEIAA